MIDMFWYWWLFGLWAVSVIALFVTGLFRRRERAFSQSVMKSMQSVHNAHITALRASAAKAMTELGAVVDDIGLSILRITSTEHEHPLLEVNLLSLALMVKYAGPQELAAGIDGNLTIELIRPKEPSGKRTDGQD